MTDVPLGKIVGLTLIAIMIGVPSVVAYNAFQNGLAFDRAVGDNFERADAASQAHTKSILFDKYVQSMKDNGLVSGQTNLYSQTPRSSLESLFNITLSLQQAMHNLDRTCEVNGTISFACSNGLHEITVNEFCWYPINLVRAGWDMQHGFGWLHWTGQDPENRCAPKK